MRMYTVIAAIATASFSAFGNVAITDNQSYQSTAGFLKITTDQATYYYHKKAGMFAGIVDKDGKDWIGWNTGASAKGVWRGLPKPYFDWQWHLQDKTGAEANVTTTIDKASGEGAKITSDDGTNKVTWEFYSTHATMKVLKAGQKYYFTYEGAPNGSFNKSSNFVVMGNAADKHLFSAGNINGDIGKNSGETWEWAYAGDNNASRVLFFAHHEDDNLNDLFNGSFDGMGVFAFGRNGNTPLFSSANQTFTIGLAESTTKAQIADAVKAAVSGSVAAIETPSARTSSAVFAVHYANDMLTVKSPAAGAYNLDIYTICGNKVYATDHSIAQHEFRIGNGIAGGSYIAVLRQGAVRYSSMFHAF